MAAFLVRRTLSGLLMIVLLTFLTFFVFNTIPTNPACIVVACGPHTTTTDAQILAADHQLGIDRSVFVQYADFAWSLVRHGDFGAAWTTHDHVGTLIGNALPITASLVGGGILLMLLIALPLGALAATRPRSPTDRGILAASVIGLAIHPFVLGLTILNFFAQRLHYYDFSYCPLTGTSPSGCGGPVGWAQHLAVPWLVFALLFLPLYMRMIRVRLLETLSEPWVSTARAKGASERRVVFGHAFRNAIGPLLPMLAIDAGTAITAAIYVETVFGLQGLGSLAVRAFSGEAGGFDLPLTAGVVTVVGTFVVLLNVCADVAGAWLDPRIRTKTLSGLIPLPRAITSRPRARLGLNLAVGAALVALLAVVVTHGGKSTTGAVDLGTPIRTVHLNADDVNRVEVQVQTASGVIFSRGFIETRVSTVDFGRYGWRVHASIENHSDVGIRIAGLLPSGTPAFYPTQPMSLIVQTDRGTGVKQLDPLPATEIVPTLPSVLAPRTNWKGTFAASDQVERGTLFYVGFGQFTYDKALDQRPVSTSTAKSGSAP